MNKRFSSGKRSNEPKSSDNGVKKKDFWDVLSSLTPLILGLAVTGVGVVFTNVYNHRQLQLNQIQALDKLRPLLTSDKTQDREFAYSSFVILGYEKMVLKMISTAQDASGKAVAQELSQSPDEAIRASANQTLEVLSKSDVLINTFETGNPKDPGEYGSKEAEAAELSNGLGIKTELGRLIIRDTLTNMGRPNVDLFAAAADQKLKTSLKKGAVEKDWLLAFFEARRAKIAASLSPSIANSKGIKDRLDKLESLIKNEDWDLNSLPAPEK